MLSPENLRFSIAILWCVVGFGSYYFLAGSSTLISRFESACKLLDRQGNQVLMQRFLGLFFLGVFSVVIILFLPGKNLQEYGLAFEFSEPLPWWTWLLIPLILILGYLTARKPANLKHYPQIRAKKWTWTMLVISSVSWVIFLVGYEFLFRGFVLFASLDIMEPTAAIALNTTVYAFAHFYKGPAETFGTIPAGILFCYLTLLTGNIWSAVVLHSVMALSNEWFSLGSHPEMSLTKDR
jgi:membrane protease YdiL (CAAX protease family)